MAFQQVDAIRFFQFDNLQGAPLKHAILTRHGGISPAPWTGLNVGATVGDESHRVMENRRRAFQSLGLAMENSYDLWQIHSTRVVKVNRPRGNEPHVQADILITNQPGLTLFMRFADCVPILLYDPKQHAAAMVHAGWKGTFLKAASHAVDALVTAFGTNPGDCIAGIGPSICAECYPIGEDVIARSEEAFGEKAGQFFLSRNGRLHLDLWKANAYVLQEAGVERIEVAGVCTAMHTEDWFSHRAEKGKTGRFGALISLG